MGEWVGYGPSQERAAHFACGHAGRLYLRHEPLDISLPTPREHLGIIQTRAVLTEQLEGDHFRFRELIRRKTSGRRIRSANGCNSGKEGKGLPSRRGTGFPPDPESPRLPCGVCGGPLEWGIRCAARPKAAWQSSQALGPAPKFEPTNHVRCAL